MAKNFLQPGNSVNVVATAAVTSGEAQLVGSLFGVALTDAALDEGYALHVTGVWRLPKATGAITVGAKLYWDAAAKKLTTTATNNTLVGLAVSAQVSGDTSVEILLLPPAVAVVVG